MRMIEIIRTKWLKKAKDVLSFYKGYVSDLEALLISMHKDRDKLLEENELLFQRNRKLERRIKELELINKALTNENNTYKVLFKDLVKELDRKPTVVERVVEVEKPVVVEKEVVKYIETEPEDGPIRSRIKALLDRELNKKTIDTVA